MESVQDFDQFLLKLDAEIAANPEAKHRIILRTLKSSNCPYLKRRVKAHFLTA